MKPVETTPTFIDVLRMLDDLSAYGPKTAPADAQVEPVAVATASGEIVWTADEYPLTDTPLYLHPPVPPAIEA